MFSNNCSDRKGPNTYTLLIFRWHHLSAYILKSQVSFQIERGQAHTIYSDRPISVSLCSQIIVQIGRGQAHTFYLNGSISVSLCSQISSKLSDRKGPSTYTLLIWSYGPISVSLCSQVIFQIGRAQTHTSYLGGLICQPIFSSNLSDRKSPSTYNLLRWTHFCQPMFSSNISDRKGPSTYRLFK